MKNRAEAINNITMLLQNSLNKNFVNFGTFTITTIEYSDAFEESIEQKQIATQNAIKAQNDTVRIQEEAKQKLISARSEAEAMEIRANALKANSNLIEYEAVQKWDGKLPQYNGGGSIPFIDLNK